MNTYKFFFYINALVISIQSITIFLHNKSSEWLLFMLLGMFAEVLAVISIEKKKVNINKGKD